MVTIEFNVSNIGAGPPFETYWIDYAVSMMHAALHDSSRLIAYYRWGFSSYVCVD